MAKRASLTDRVAAQQLAGEWVAGNMPTMQRIARGCHVDVCEVTGPSVDAVASLLLQNADPADNVALLRDYVKRELWPSSQTADPMVLATHGGTLEPLDLYSNWLYHAGKDGRVRHALSGRNGGGPSGGPSGRNHRRAGWRARARRERAIETGQSAFTGADWRKPVTDGGVLA
jgi:hypothetical protein